MESWVVGARATRACLQSSRTGAGEGQCHYEKNYEVGLLIKLIKFIKPTRMECAETRKLRDRRLSACSRARLGRYFVGTFMKNFLMWAVPSALRFDKIS